MPSAQSDPAAGLESQLVATLAALGLETETGQRKRLLAYLLLLQRWNAVHNLSATRDIPGLLQQHVTDCLSVVQPLTRYAAGRSVKILDAGTGAGLPAMILAIMRPDWAVTAADSVGKKVAFIRQAVGELGLRNLDPRHARLEGLSRSEGHFDVVTARAFSSLGQLVETTRHLIDPMGAWMAMKGIEPEAEIRALPKDCQLFHVEPLTVPGLHAERCLVWIRPISQTH